jgi:hypothetical protein
MKVRQLVRQLFRAIVQGKKKKQRRLYDEITRKSLAHKRTQAVR